MIKNTISKEYNQKGKPQTEFSFYYFRIPLTNIVNFSIKRGFNAMLCKPLLCCHLTPFDFAKPDFNEIKIYRFTLYTLYKGLSQNFL